MGILKRLFPWYRWDDRWAHHIFTIPDGDFLEPVNFVAPPGFRLQLLSIVFDLDAGAGLPKRFVDVEICRGSQRFFHMTSGASASGSAITEIAIIRNLARASTTAAAFHLFDNLSDTAYMLPGDRLNIGIQTFGAFDRIINIVISAQRWID